MLPTARARALWFTGEIHIVDKNVQPTTSRSDFIENVARAKLYAQAQSRIPLILNSRAQTISDNRKAFQDAKNIRQNLEKVKTQLENGGIEQSDIKIVREELEKSFRKLASRKNPTDKDIGNYQKEVRRLGQSLQDELNNPKKLKQGQSVPDLVKDLDMPTKARKVFQIVMETLQQHFSDDKDEYHRLRHMSANAASTMTSIHLTTTSIRMRLTGLVVPVPSLAVREEDSDVIADRARHP